MTFHAFFLLISPVASPRMTMAELWLPALPAVPVSMVRNSAMTRCRCRQALPHSSRRCIRVMDHVADS